MPKGLRWVGTLGVVLCLMMALPAMAQNNAAAKAQLEKRLNDAVAALIKEANGLENVNDDPKPRFSRPHPTMNGWGSEMSMLVLNRMNQQLTGNEYRDTYIRWHLMWAVKKVEDDQRDQMSQRLVRLVQEMPGPLKVTRKREVTYDPPEKYTAWRRAHDALRVVRGYPPFQTYVDPPASLSELGPDAQARWEEVQRMRKEFTSTTDKDAVAFNRLVDRMNFIVREYRGEVIYAMFQTGDPAMLRTIFMEIDKQARAKNGVAFDLMTYAYMAAFDGLFSLYDPSLLNELSNQLERTAKATEEYVEYARQRRNFAEYAFHMIYMLRDAGSFQEKPPVAGRIGRNAPAPARGSGRFTAENLTLEDIRKAIDAGVKALYTQEYEPNYGLVDEARLRVGRLFAGQQAVRFATGNHALVCWALLSAGESYQNPQLYRRINWVLSSDTVQTYDRAMRMQMLAELPRTRWSRWIHRDRLWLTSALTTQGNYDELWHGVADKGPGDNANGQYGVLGLWGAERSGESIRADVWRKIDEYWRKAQRPVSNNNDPEAPSGWAIYTFDSENQTRGRQNPSNTRISGPMTAGGVAVLSLTERYLYGDKVTATEAMRRQLPHLRRGIRWLDANFSLDDKAEESDRYYYFWTIQRVGHVTGYRTFNKVDWYRQITATMLNEQTADGTWAGDKGRLLSTGFSLLYLGKAHDPLAISKIRVDQSQVAPGNAQGRLFDAAWNAKPHDMWNFVDFVSDLYETSVTWQIVELDQPVYELIESPILYLSTDSRITFTDKQVDNLFQYLQAGGTLVINRDQTTGDSAVTVRDLMAKLTSKFKKPLTVIDRAPADHPLMTIHMPIRNAPMRIYDDGMRPVVIEFLTDLGAGLQGNDPYGRGADSFNALSNIFLYSTGMNTRRKRMESNYVPRIARSPGNTVRVARLKHDGNFDPQPGALTQLANIVANQHDINLQIEAELPAGRLSNQQKMAFLTTTGDGKLSAEEATAIRNWVKQGGTLWIDAAGGSAEASAKANEFLKAIMPDASLVPLANDHAIIDGKPLGGTENRFVKFRKFLLLRTGRGNTPRLMGVEVDGRVAIVFSNEDITAGLAGLDHWRIFGYTPEFARRLVVNHVLAISRGVR